MSGVRPASSGRTWNRTRQPGPSGPSAPTHTCGSSFPSSTSGSSIPAGLGKGLEKFWGQQRGSGLHFLPQTLCRPPGGVSPHRPRTFSSRNFCKGSYHCSRSRLAGSAASRKVLPVWGFRTAGEEAVGPGAVPACAQLAPPPTPSSYPRDTAGSLWCQESCWTGQIAWGDSNQGRCPRRHSGQGPPPRRALRMGSNTFPASQVAD